MGRIKSALEIALERTESVKGDRGNIEQFEAKQRGKKLANEFLSGEKLFLEDEIRKFPREHRESLKQGVFDVLLSQITLPDTPEDEKRIELAGKGLQAVIKNSRFNTVYKQFTQNISLYLSEAQKYEEAIHRQYAPKLKQKEEELSRRYGQAVKLDPFQDPEFVSFYNLHMSNLRNSYEILITQIQEEARKLYTNE